MSALEEWGGFYGVVGSAAGALIGLQFVVMTLVASTPRIAAPDAGAAFATPTIVHFGSVLLLAALLHVPWHDITVVSALWGLMGISGLAYALIVARRMLRQTSYRPQLEDWVFHAMLPILAYVILTVSPFAASAYPRAALFGVGAAALLLLFIGIHNAWDGIAYHVFVTLRDSRAERRREEDPDQGTSWHEGSETK
jgi:hypothetical protein